jgi:nicotinate-nucleotide adenylyltransferase
VAVVDRPGWHLAASASRAARTFARNRIPETKARLILRQPAPAWTLLTGPLSKLSSTALRADRRLGR